MKPIRLIAATALVLSLVACQHNVNTNPQLTAAINNDRGALALNTFCKQEVNFKAQIDPQVHKVIQQKCLQLATLDDAVANAIAANDLTSAKSQLGLAIGVAQGMNADLLNIKDQTTQQALIISQGAVVTALESWQVILAQQSTTTTGGKQ